MRLMPKGEPDPTDFLGTYDAGEALISLNGLAPLPPSDRLSDALASRYGGSWVLRGMLTPTIPLWGRCP